MNTAASHSAKNVSESADLCLPRVRTTAHKDDPVNEKVFRKTNYVLSHSFRAMAAQKHNIQHTMETVWFKPQHQCLNVCLRRRTWSKPCNKPPVHSPYGQMHLCHICCNGFFSFRPTCNQCQVFSSLPMSSFLTLDISTARQRKTTAPNYRRPRNPCYSLEFRCGVSNLGHSNIAHNRHMLLDKLCLRKHVDRPSSPSHGNEILVQ